MITKNVHVHEYKKLAEKKVLLASWRSEGGKSKYINTTGYDMLKQRVCECGKILTYDLERKLT